MKAETYRRKAEELREKAASTNPRFWRKIEAMEAEADRLEERAAEKEAEEAAAEEDDDDIIHIDWDDDDDNDDDEWDDDDEEDDDCDDEEEDEEDDDDEDGVDVDIEAIKEKLRVVLSDHTEAFIEKALESPDVVCFPVTINEIIEYAYSELSDEECMDDLEYVMDLTEAGVEFMREKFHECFEPWDSSGFISSIEIYDEAYRNAMKIYGDDDRARAFARSCYDAGEVFDIDTDFEDYVRDTDEWMLLGLYGDEEWSADDIIEHYYQSGADASYGDGHIYMGAEHFMAKDLIDDLNKNEGSQDDD